MGIVEAPRTWFGFEIAGVVRRMGPDVTSVRVGERVLATCTRGFSTVEIVNEGTCERLPDRLSFLEAATMPVVYTTALYCLQDVGNLQKGQASSFHRLLNPRLDQNG